MRAASGRAALTPPDVLAAACRPQVQHTLQSPLFWCCCAMHDPDLRWHKTSHERLGDEQLIGGVWSDWSFALPPELRCSDKATLGSEED